MSITEELIELIVLHGSARDALNVTLAKLCQAQNEIAVLKEAAQQSVQADVAKACIYCGSPHTPYIAAQQMRALDEAPRACIHANMLPSEPHGFLYCPDCGLRQ